MRKVIAALLLITIVGIVILATASYFSPEIKTSLTDTFGGTGVIIGSYFTSFSGWAHASATNSAIQFGVYALSGIAIGVTVLWLWRHRPAVLQRQQPQIERQTRLKGDTQARPIMQETTVQNTRPSTSTVNQPPPEEKKE